MSIVRFCWTCSDIEDIGATINTSGVFSQVNEIEEKLQEIKDKIETSASTDMCD